MKEVAHLYEDIAEWFDTNRQRGLIEAPYLNLALENVPAKGTVLDLGCGAGEPIAQFFIECGFTVTGVDISPKMIALCRERFPAAHWIVGDIRNAGIQGRFDVTIAWDSFFHLDPDAQRGMFGVFGAHTKEGGVLIFTSGPKSGEVYGTMQGHAFYHASLDSEEYKGLLEKYGFQVILNKVEDPDCGLHTVWVAKKISSGNK